ncbi:[Fe-Fe] hydrogenase large subunit C-terminal domain-containing protein [Halothermothrix orenii]|uniref:Ferredoxin hydrogenase n=1 Tax=Halothermothrix orenii (strain H 168 / OCM 544 / DSM 9562) TaxID=373903 RepID=B8D1H1_HALOH|nr:[Fe-Fe] hydrogenase large subunit C-terminal domain-containing protein [Halothermothrix orenii]ACL69048.1 Ferredoxin hydrogenase [Halothermothrix orenii H 168]
MIENSNYQSLRKDIFKQLCKDLYNDQIKKTINNLPYQLTKKDSHEELDLIKNEILLAMGLNPTAKNDTELSAELNTALNLKEVKQPVVTVNRKICDLCQKKYGPDYCRVGCDINEKEGLLIEDGRCISCGKCIPKCPLEAVSDKVEFFPLYKYLKNDTQVYANVAPAIMGQFGEKVTAGHLRSAFKKIGFTDMVEVALFADIVTLREADEYNRLVQKEGDFMITSCCCPVWVNMVTKHYPSLNNHLTRTVSPMIASGRLIKLLFPDAITVFIGPCIAKKAEAKHPELKGAIDFVLTFDELDLIFEALNIDPARLPEDNKEQSSRGGRVYARTGGVSQAVSDTVKRLSPHEHVKFKANQADGVKNCKKLLDELKEGKVEATFIEGMGCEGGCVGGPKRINDIKEATRLVNKFGSKARSQTPIDNNNIYHIFNYLTQLIESQEQIIDEETYDNILVRK